MKEQVSEQEREAAVEWLESKLGPLPKAVKFRISEDAILDFYSGFEEDRKLLLDRVRVLLGVYEDRPASAGAAKTGRGKELRGSAQEIAVELDPYTRHRGKVFSEVAVALAEQRRDVRNLRWRLRSYPLSHDEADDFLTQQGKIRWKLDRLAATLARFYGWRERDVALFILTGEEPVYRPLRVQVAFGDSSRPHVPNTARVVIEADTWVDAKEVVKAYRAAQRQLLGGGDNRKVQDQVLEVARFVARRLREHGGKESWNEWWREWNEKHPEKYPKGWRYSAPHGFKQAFERFVHPKYRRPKWKRRGSG